VAPGRPWLAAVLQTGVNLGVLTATVIVMLMKGLPERTVFLVGVIPAFMVFWIRKSVPEPEEWSSAKTAETHTPRFADLFAPRMRRITVTTITVCATALTAHWAFMFWGNQHVKQLAANNPEQGWSPSRAGEVGLLILMVFSIIGNFAAGALAKRWGYRTSVIAMCLLYTGSMVITYAVPRSVESTLWLFAPCGFSQGLFALFTMYLPSLFPTLLRTTGAGFCYNIGRLAAAAGTVAFGAAAVSVDYRMALLATAVLFLPSAGAALLLPEPRGDDAIPEQPME